MGRGVGAEVRGCARGGWAVGAGGCEEVATRPADVRGRAAAASAAAQLNAAAGAPRAATPLPPPPPPLPAGRQAPVHAGRAGHDASVGQRKAVALLAAGQNHGGVAKGLTNHLRAADAEGAGTSGQCKKRRGGVQTWCLAAAATAYPQAHASHRPPQAPPPPPSVPTDRPRRPQRRPPALPPTPANPPRTRV